MATPHAGTSRSASHRLEPVAADGFSLFVGRPGRHARRPCCPRCGRTALPAWGWDLPVGGGTYHALFPRAWQTFEPDVLGVRLVGEQLSPVIARRPRAERAACRGLRVVGREPGARPVDGRAPAHVGRSARRPTRPGRRPRPHRVVERPDRRRALRRRRPRRPDRHCGARSRWPRSRDDGVDDHARAGFDPVADTELWADFAADGRLEPAPPVGGRPASGRAGGRRRRGDHRARPGRAAGRPLRPRLGPADRRVRRRPALVEALHAGVGPDRPARRGPGRHALAEAPRLAGGDRGAGRRPILDDPAPARLVRAALFNELYFLVDGGLVLGGRRGRRPGARPPTTRAGSPCSSASTTRSTTRSTSTSTPRSRC